MEMKMHSRDRSRDLEAFEIVNTNEHTEGQDAGDGPVATFRESIQEISFMLHDVISSSKLINIQRLENEIYVDAKGGMYLSWRFLLIHLMGFFSIGFFFWFLIPCVICTSRVRAHLGVKNPILLFLVPFFLLAPFTPFLLCWLWGMTWHSLVELLRANAISGAEVLLPLLLPWALSAHITQEVYLISISKQILWSTFEEFDQLGMFDETISRGEFYGREKNSIVKNVHHYLESVDAVLSFGPLGKIFGDQVNVISRFHTGDDDLDWLLKGNAGALPKDMYMQMTMERRRPRLDAWQNVVSTLASIVFSIVPGWYMYLVHGDTYLHNQSTSLIFAAVVSVVTLGIISFGCLRILFVRIRHLRLVRQQSALLLYLSASEKSRQAVWRRYYRELSTTQIVGDSTQSDESDEFHSKAARAYRAVHSAAGSRASCLHGTMEGFHNFHDLLTANIEDHNPIEQEEIDRSEESIEQSIEQSISITSRRARRALTIASVSSKAALAKGFANANERMHIKPTKMNRLSIAGMPTMSNSEARKAMSEAIDQANFQMLDVEMFIFLRMFFRIYITYENVRIQNFLSASVFVAFVALIHYICSSLVFDSIIGSQVIDIVVVLTVLFTLLTVLDSMVVINSALFETTIEVLLDWKERVHRVGHQVDMRCPMSALSNTRLLFDHYFDSMIQRVDRTIERIEKMEIPMSLFTIRISVAARNRFLFTVIMAALGHMCMELHKHVTLMKPFFNLKPELT